MDSVTGEYDSTVVPVLEDPFLERNQSPAGLVFLDVAEPEIRGNWVIGQGSRESFGLLAGIARTPLDRAVQVKKYEEKGTGWLCQ